MAQRLNSAAGMRLARAGPVARRAIGGLEMERERAACCDAVDRRTSTNRVAVDAYRSYPESWNAMLTKTTSTTWRRPPQYGQRAQAVAGASDLASVYTIFPSDVRSAADSLAAATPLTDPVNLYPLSLGISIVRTEEAARSAVRERAEGGMVAIKITVESGPTTFGDDHPQMSVEMIRAIVDEAARNDDLPVFAHISSLDELQAVLEGGAAGTVHSVWDDPLPGAALADQMRAARFTIVPTLSLYAGAISLGYIDEPVDLGDPFLRTTVSDEEVAALRNPAFLERFRRGRAVSGSGSNQATEIERRMKDVIANVGMLHDRGVTIVVGTDTGNPYVFPGYSVHQELELLVRSGLTPMEALEAGTRRAAEMIGAGEQFGTIEVGKRADILILEENPLETIRNTRSLEVVISEGRVVDRDALLARTR